MQAVKGLERLHNCAGSPDPSLLDIWINIKIHILAHLFFRAKERIQKEKQNKHYAAQKSVILQDLHKRLRVITT